MTGAVTTQSAAETVATGRELGGTLVAGAVVLLAGELGAGKTTFVRGIAEGLGIDPADVSSPTFTIVQEYRGGRLPLHHVDLYRLTPREVDELGLDEMMEDGVMVVEWPDRLPWTVSPAIAVRIDYGAGDARTITITQLPDHPITPTGNWELPS